MARCLRIVSDHLDSPAAGKARLRIVHAGIDAGQIDVRAAGSSSALFDDVDYQTVSDYKDVAPMNGAIRGRRRRSRRRRLTRRPLRPSRGRPVLHARDRRERRDPVEAGGFPDRRRVVAVRKRTEIIIGILVGSDRRSPASGLPSACRALEPRLHEWVTSTSQQVARKRSRARRGAPQLDAAPAARART